MNSLNSLNTLALVIAFLVPGLIARWTWKTIVVSATVDPKTEVLSSIVASAWLYAVVSPLIYCAWAWQLPLTSPKLFVVSLFGIVFAWPVVAGFVMAKMMTSRPWKRLTSAFGVRSPEPRAWDTFFARREPCFVRVIFQDGVMLGGLFHERSAVSCFPAPEDLFLEALYRLDPKTGKFVEPLPETMGGWVDMKTVRHLEFFVVSRKEQNNDDDIG